MEGGHSTRNSGMWNIEHEISSPTLYELLIKTELKGDTALNPNNFYNHINMCLNAVNRPKEDLLPDYQYIKGHSEFEENFVLDRDNPSYY